LPQVAKQIGEAASFGDLSTAALNGGSAFSIDLSTPEGAQAALDAVSNATDYLAGQRAQVGAYSNRLSFAEENLMVSIENITAAESTIKDADD